MRPQQAESENVVRCSSCCSDQGELGACERGATNLHPKLGRCLERAARTYEPSMGSSLQSLTNTHLGSQTMVRTSSLWIRAGISPIKRCCRKNWWPAPSQARVWDQLLESMSCLSPGVPGSSAVHVLVKCWAGGCLGGRMPRWRPFWEPVPQ